MRGRARWIGAFGAGALACGAPERPGAGLAPEPEGSGGAESTSMRVGVDEVVSVKAPESAPAPTMEAGRYVFRMGAIELVVDPEIGGRVIRFSSGGENVLTGPEVVAGGEGALPNMYGSTFWTSPQSAWGWPPEAAIDAAPYQVVVDGGVLALSSEPGAATGYAVRKRFWADPARDVISIEYTLQNRAASVPAAPWEISRVPKEGFVFFAAAAPPLTNSSLSGTLADGIAWIDISRAPEVDSKLFQDGAEGWLAYVRRGLAFIKTFDDLRQEDAAPGEAEIEVFVNGRYDYAELEEQGRYVLPPPGGTSSWRVSWMLRRVPAELDASLGNGALVAWVRSQVAQTRR